MGRASRPTGRHGHRGGCRARARFAGQLDEIEGGHGAGFAIIETAFAQSELDVAEGGEMREQRIALKHGTDVALIGLQCVDGRAVEKNLAGSRLFEAADQVNGCLEMARAVAESVVLREHVPFEAADESWVVATDLAEALARNGTAFHQAHQIVGRLVLESVRSGKKPGDWTAASLAQFAPEFTPDVARLLDPREGMKTREIAGGTGPATVAAALAEAHLRLADVV